MKLFLLLLLTILLSCSRMPTLEEREELNKLSTWIQTVKKPITIQTNDYLFSYPTYTLISADCDIYIVSNKYISLPETIEDYRYKAIPNIINKPIPLPKKEEE